MASVLLLHLRNRSTDDRTEETEHVQTDQSWVRTGLRDRYAIRVGLRSTRDPDGSQTLVFGRRRVLCGGRALHGRRPHRPTGDWEDDLRLQRGRDGLVLERGPDQGRAPDGGPSDARPDSQPDNRRLLLVRGSGPRAVRVLRRNCASEERQW